MEKLELARKALTHVVDPEIGLNIVDLGLIYDLRLIESNSLYVLMTFTTMGCPVSGALTSGVKRALEPLGFDKVVVDITYSPAWSPTRMSPEARQALGAE